MAGTLPTSVSAGIQTASYLLPGVSNGVATIAPPSDLLPSITSAIDKACTAIPKDKHAALVGVVLDKDGEKRANGALVVRVGESFKVMTWLGKSWGTTKSTEIGAAISLVL